MEAKEQLTAQQKVKHMILTRIANWRDRPLPEFSAASIDEAYEAADEDDIQDMSNEVREGQFETGLRCEWSRHYESKAVAAQALDGSWVGWTYWYGGGKHGEPEAIDWIEYAYDVTCKEEEKLVVVREFALAAEEGK